MQGVFHDHVDDPDEVRHVVDVLDMWTFMEEAYISFSAGDKKKLVADVGPRADSVAFPGFDGNNESSQLGIACFLIEDMGRFQRFKGRDLNSHHRTEERYRRCQTVHADARNAHRNGLSVGRWSNCSNDRASRQSKRCIKGSTTCSRSIDKSKGLLFCTHDSTSPCATRRTEMHQEVESLDANRLLNTAPDDLKTYLDEKYR